MEEILRQSEERFRLLVEGVRDYAIFLLDPEGYITSWNAGAERIKGYTADEIIGQHFSRFYPPEALARSWPEHELHVAKLEGRFEDEGWRVRKDGTRFWANVVITALRDADGHLRGFAKVTRDMTDRRKIAELEESERHLNEFLAMLAHELRNPLAPIRNAVSALRRRPDEATVEWSAAVIDRQVNQLSRLVEDLLDVSRITNGKVHLRKEPGEVAAAVAGVVAASRPQIEARKLQLEVAVEPEQMWVEGDPARLTQIVQNLLDNAIKYTPAGGRIRVAAGRQGNLAVVSIRDWGIGMPAELLPKIFEPFTQGDRSLDRSEGGLGIGLTLVHRLVALHGGTVLARSEGSGLGSELIVRFPLLAAVPAPPPNPVAEEPQAARQRVLAVDDNRDAVETMAVLLDLWGYEVERAENGPDAIAKAEAWRPEIVLLDIGLPGMSGYEVAKRLRAMPGLEPLLLIAVTGYGQEEDRRRSAESGFDHHLVKPVDPEELRKLLAALPVERSPVRQPPVRQPA